MKTNPKLRVVDFQPVYFQGRQMWFLRDPLNLSQNQIIVPYEMTPLFPYLDGTKNSTDIHHAFCQASGENVPIKIIIDAIDQLDNAFLLDNERARNAIAAQLKSYRALPYRPLSLAGHGYPEDADELTVYLDSFSSGTQKRSASWQGRGIVSPHIDYQRGGPVYAQVWHQAADAVASAELIIILGTDHNGNPNKITLTRQAYATPYGTLPIDEQIVDILSDGQASVFEDEIHHRDEHSIELSAVWLHYTLRKKGIESKPMIPILIGSFHHYLGNGSHPRSNGQINQFLKNLHKIATNKKVLVVSSVDLAHIGPNFGDPFTIQSKQKTDQKKYDSQLMESALKGDADAWFNNIASVQDRHRICGFSPTYLLLRYLGATNGTQIAYDQCPADEDNTSIVSICGLLID